MKLDELDYIGQDETIYDVLNKKLPILNGDYSTLNLINGLSLLGDSPLLTNEYKKIIKDSAEIIQNALLPEENETKKMTAEEKENLLVNLQSLRALNNTIPVCEKMEDYLEYVTSENFIMNPSALLLRNIIIQEALKYAPDDYEKKIRKELMSTAYLPKYREFVKQQGVVRKQQVPQEQEEIQAIYSFVLASNNLAEYDALLESMKTRMDFYNRKAIMAVACEAKRARFVRNALLETLPPERTETLKKEGLNIPELLFNHTEYKQNENSFVWDVKEFKNPQVVMDTTAKYTNDGSADQRVIAISYGKFAYGNIFQKDGRPTYVSDFMELVGVSRIGEDGQKNYFILVPFMNKEFEKDGTFDYQKYMKAQKNPDILPTINYGYNGEAYALNLERIPEEVRAFYANVYFSDVYLKNVIENNYRYAGMVTVNNHMPQIEASDKTFDNSTDMEAARFAMNHFSQNYHFIPLKDDASFASLYSSQNRIIKEIMERTKQKDDMTRED